LVSAHEIVENDRRRQELERQELDSDSELSVLASSLFNGMEGVEYGGDATPRQEDEGILDGQDSQYGEGMEVTQRDGESSPDLITVSPEAIKP
jgi:hypothetical protein